MVENRLMSALKRAEDHKTRNFEILWIVKDDFPHLFLGFRNKYFNKISLDNMLYFHS